MHSNSEDKKHIIFVDDDRVVLRGYHRALEFEGHETRHYVDIDRFFSYITTHTVDMLVVDIMMPCGDRYANRPTSEGLFTGLFLAQDVHEHHPHVPIIFFSNATFTEVREAAQHYAAKKANYIFLEKLPTSPRDLCNIINSYFTKGHF